MKTDGRPFIRADSRVVDQRDEKLRHNGTLENKELVDWVCCALEECWGIEDYL